MTLSHPNLERGMRMNSRSEDRKPSTTKRMIIMVVIVGLLLAALIGWNVMGKIMGAKFAANMPVAA